MRLVSALMLGACSLLRSDKGTITGTVVAPSQVPIPGAKVTLVDAGGSRQTVNTGRTGHYTFSSVAAGAYMLSVEANGYYEAIRSDVKVTPGASTTMDLALAAAASPGSAQALPLSAPPAYYDGTQLKPSSVKSAIDAAGYSSQAQNPRRLLSEVPSLQEDGQGGVARAHEDSDIKEFQLAAQKDPSEKNLFARGNALLLHDLVEPALEVFRRGVALYPSSRRMYIGLSIALDSRGFYKETADALCHASGLDPSDPRPYLFLGKLPEVSAANADDVRKRLKRFMETNPSNPFAYYYYALSSWKAAQRSGQRADLTEIEILLRKALQLDSQMAEGHLQIGILLQYQHRDREATPEFQSALRLKPHDPESHYRLAQAYLRAGDKEQGEEELQLYEKLCAP